MMKNANIVGGSIGQIAVLRTVRMMTMYGPLFPPVADAKSGAVAVAVRKEMETGGMLMTIRYIALHMCDSAVVRNVFRMNVDVVYIGYFTPSNPALACR